MQQGISAPDAYDWLSRWAANAARWIVPGDSKVGQSGQTQGQGFHAGYVIFPFSLSSLR